MKLSNNFFLCGSGGRSHINYSCLSHISLLLYTMVINLQGILGQVGQECHFPRLTPRHSLNLSKFMGTWFLHEFAASDPSFNNVQPQFSCSKVNYVGTSSDISNGRFVAFETFLNQSSGRLESFSVPINVPNMRNPVNAIWDAVTVNGKTKMVVLGSDTEHRKWNLLYGCNVGGPTGNYRWETVAIWTRNPQLDPMQREILKDLLVGLGMPPNSHKFHSQNNCPQF